MKIRDLILIILIIIAIVFSSYISNEFSLLNTRNGIWSYAGEPGFTNMTLHIPLIPNGSSQSGIFREVAIKIDNTGTAHIYAQNLHDLFFAQGFYMAYTRLFQMEIQSLMASGNLSKYVGKEYLSSDLAMRYLGLPYNAYNLVQYYKDNYPQYYSYLEAFSQGINYYIDNFKEPVYFLLAGFKPFQWSPFYSLVWEEYMTLFLTTGIYEPLYSDIFLNNFGYGNLSLYYPYYPYFTQNITVMPGDGAVNGYSLLDQGIAPGYLWHLNWYQDWATGVQNGTLGRNEDLLVAALNNISDPIVFQFRGMFNDVGSNSWVVTSNYSTTGYPMLANDPHLTLTIPSLWVPMQLNAPCINVTGWSLSGIPGVLIGHTSSTSWGITDSEGNSANDYLEIFSGNSYLYNGSLHPLQYRNFTYMGRDYSIAVTNNGPVIARMGNYGISVNWTAEYGSPVLIAELMLDESQNYTDMINALRYWGYPPENFALVSLHHAGYITAGNYPLIREKLPNGKYVSVIGSRSLLNGTIPDYEPIGYVPFQYLPQVKDPERGYAFAPNQPTAYVNYPYPFIGGFWSSGGRATTIADFLSTHRMNITNMMILQSNITDSWAKMLVPMLTGILSERDVSGVYLSALNDLKAWNFTAGVHSTGMTIYWYSISYLYNDTFNASFSAKGVTFLPLPFITSIIYSLQTDSFNFFEENQSQLVYEAFTQAVSYLSSRFGNNISSWEWGKVHFLLIQSLTGLNSISLGPVPFYGDDHTVSVGPVTSLPQDYYYVTLSSSLREISSPAGNTFLGVFPGGASEDFYSPYYSNQFQKWYDHEYYNFNDYSIEEVIVLE